MINTSLIITVFNRSHLIRKALLSLQNQSVKPDELILSDDGSTEDIVAAISDIVQSFDFPVKFVQQENKGFRLAKCRNNGVRNSNGNLLIFLDQDLIHTKNVIDTFIKSYKKSIFISGVPIWLSKEKSALITDDKIINNNFLELISDSERRYIDKHYRKNKFYYYMHKLNLVNKPPLRGGCCAIDKEDFVAINGYDEKYIGWGSEDDDMGHRLYSFGRAGVNPFRKEYTLHLYHEKASIKNVRLKEQANYRYHSSKREKILSGEFRTEYGFDNPFDEDTVSVVKLN
ncbi:MAG: glycosyltransferase [Melioribacteraceae bacterium]|nr:glycosyltransferase [Melioribacteraceae bacterium]